jgi:putative heme-binding domain-containing protein
LDSASEWVYVADVGSNLIHRKRLTCDGVTYRGERVDEATEFVRSTDIWFRPVQMAIGPEGALYVADMYREVIEHPASLPPELKRQLDLTSGNDRGRIYRIVPADFQQAPQRSLADAGTAELVEALDHANAWRRTTAARLVYERQDPAAADLLRKQLIVAQRPEGCIAVLYALESLQALTPDDVLAGLSDEHPQVRRHAIRLSEPFLGSSAAVRNKVLSLSADADPSVQFQLALSLGESPEGQIAEVLASILMRNVENQDIVDAALTSLHAHAGEVLKYILADDEWCSQPQAERVIGTLVRQIVRQRREGDLGVLISALAPTGRAATVAQTVVLMELAELSTGVSQQEDSRVLKKLHTLQRSAASQLIHEAEQVLGSGDSPLQKRLAAIEHLRLDTFENQRELLAAHLSPQEPSVIHTAVLETCAQYDAREVAGLVLAHWNELGPAERSQATDLLLRREVWTLQLLRHLRDEDTPLTTLDPSHVARMESFPSEAVRELAQSLRGQGVSRDRREIFSDYRDGIAADGNSARGKLVFEKNCSTCHELESGGSAVGPNLAAMVNRGTESLLFNILAPNGEVDPRYLEYVVLTVDGQVVTGIIAGETSTAVTVRGADNKTTTVLRVDIEELRNTGRSLMPEGLEKVIDKNAMADLLAYLTEAASGASK